MSGPALFDRRCKLLVASAGGSALDLGGLHCKFSITRSDVQSPNWADITIYNVKRETAARIKKEGVRVVLQAGYVGLVGVIFDGQIKQTRFWRQDGVDSILSIAAADGDVAYNSAVVNKTLEAGASLQDEFKAAIAPMSAHGVDLGFHDDELAEGGPGPRGRVMFGMARDHLRTAARGAGATWSIQNGKVEVIKRTKVIGGKPIVLSPRSGLIGTPVQTERGVEAQSLLNPDLRVGARVQIDRSLIQEAQLQAPTGGSSSSSAKTEPKPVAADGFYRVILAEFSGDTRGTDWYVNVVGLPLKGGTAAEGVGGA